VGLLLVANPGSSSRKYALYTQGEFAPEPVANLNIESSSDGLIATLHIGNDLGKTVSINFDDIAQSALHAEEIMRSGGAIKQDDKLGAIAVRIVAPGSYFMYDHVVDEEFMVKLREAEELAPIHIKNVLNELTFLYESHSNIPVMGISDSAFHATKPSYAWNPHDGYVRVGFV
jgi:acetate kinase